MPRHSAVCTHIGCPHLRPCPIHGGGHTGWSSGRDRGAQAAFRVAVLERDRYTCRGCGLTDPTGKQLRAAHLVPLAEGGGYDPSEGVTRCQECDRRTDRYAR